MTPARPRSAGSLPPFGADFSAEARERIRRLRLLRRWDQATLADRAGTNPTAISMIETGRMSPTTEHVEGIARALGYSVEAITRNLNLSPTTRPWLRAYADASRREADARTAGVTTAVEFIRRLELRPLPDLIPDFPGDLDDVDELESAAAELRLISGLDSDAVVPNMIRAAERLGCIVLPLSSEMGRHMGMSVRSDDLPVVCVAAHGIPGDRQRFTVAHELGHLVLHSDAGPPRDAAEASRMERQANVFAAAFLGPGDALIETLNENGGRVTLRTLAAVKAVWGISIKGLVGRFKALGVIDEHQAESLYKQISARRWSKSEPVEVPLESAQWFERSLLRAAGEGDLHGASASLAPTIGVDAADLFGFASWDPPAEKPVLSVVR